MHTVYTLFYREKGVRYVSELINLRETKLDRFPRSALFHYVPGENGQPEIDVNQPYFQDYSKKILFDYVTEYVQVEGTVRKPMFNLVNSTREFRREHQQKWQYLEDAWKTDHNPESLHVINYGYLDVIYHYPAMQMSSYYRWLNRQRTVWAKAAEIARVSDRQQFIVIPIPDVLHGRTVLDKYAREPASLKVAQIFGQHGWAGFMQLDLWRWLDTETRKHSLIDLVDAKDYNKISLVFQGTSGDQSIVNLGYLNSWIKGQPNTTGAGNVVQFDNVYMKNIFLKLSMTLNAILVDKNPEADIVVPENQAVTPEPRLSKEPEANQPVKTVDEVLFDDQKSTELEADSLAQDEDSESESAIGPVHAQSPTATTSKAKDVPDSDSDIHRPDVSKELMSELEKDMEVLDRLSLKQLQVSGLKMDAVNDQVLETEVNVEDVKKEVFVPVHSSDILQKRLDQDAEANLLTAADYRKLKESTVQYLKSADPYGSSLSRIEAMKIVPEDISFQPDAIEIADKAAVPDKSMNRSSLQQYDKQYLKKVYRKDVLQAVNSIQAAGVVIRRHEIDVTHSALGSYEQHTLELKPIDGAPSVLQFTFPKVEDDGTFLAGGNKYLLRKQRVDLPIRKIAPQIVSLSSYYGKTFVQTNPKVVNSSLAWLYRQINMASFDQDSFISEVNPSNVFDNDFKAPYIYNALAQEYSQIRVGSIRLDFDHRHRQLTKPEILKSVEKDGRVLVGINGVNEPIVVDRENNFIVIGKQGEINLGSIYDVLKLDTAKCPVDIAEVRVFSKYIPVGVVLSYYLGFSRMLALVGETYRIVEGRKQKNLAKDEYAISFRDESFIFKTSSVLGTMIVAGFNDFEKTLKLYDRKDFENKDVYLNLLMSKGMAAIYIRELDMLENCFIDPITREILEDMKEPVTFKGLLIRSCELLKTYDHPASQDRSVMRDRGYERFAGAMYKELMTATRQFRNKNLVGRSKIDMSPYQVWNAIMKDSSLKIVEDTNPVQNLKEAEVITFSGTGGRDKDTMTKPTRAFHKNDVGVLSESTVDSSSVGTIAYLSANPNIKNVRGLMGEEKELSPTNMLSTSALLSPASMNDNPKRVMFITTQHSHTIASAAYRQPYVRTGYESVIGQRTSKMFSTAAAEDGKVTAITDKGIIVTYKSGEQTGIELGRVYGKAEGTVYPHDLVTTFKEGDSFKKGDILSYNSKFFEKDFLNPKDVIFKTNAVVTVAFTETNQTHEDSCSISEELGARFKTEVTKIKSYIVDFKQNLLDVRKAGEKIEPKDILMIIEDEITAAHTQFSDDALSTLKRLSNVAPRAGVVATVEKIELFYHGDKQDMTASLKRLADKSDNDMAAAAKASGRPIVNGKVSDEYRVSGTPLELDKAEVRIYLTITNSTGVGDKVVFGHQMKSTIAEVHRGSIHTENGETVDATFSYGSVARRGVLSPAILGTTITLLDAISKNAAKLYFGES